MFSHLINLLRTLRHHPAYSALNVLGLALALACSLLLYWLVRFTKASIPTTRRRRASAGWSRT